MLLNISAMLTCAGLWIINAVIAMIIKLHFLSVLLFYELYMAAMFGLSSVCKLTCTTTPSHYLNAIKIVSRLKEADVYSSLFTNITGCGILWPSQGHTFMDASSKIVHSRNLLLCKKLFIFLRKGLFLVLTYLSHTPWTVGLCGELIQTDYAREPVQ